MPQRPHDHPCQQCLTPTDCYGELEANDDGWPLVRCRAFHLDSGQIDDLFLCDDCRERLVRDTEASDAAV